MLKKYKFGFEPWAVILFLAIMAPNIYWFANPTANDVLRRESVTPCLDLIASISQVVMVAVLCLLKRRDVSKIKLSKNIFFMIASYILYIVSWLLYFSGNASAVLILSLCITPCLAFAFYAFDRKNYLALFPLGVFFICHVVFGIVNFIA